MRDELSRQQKQALLQEARLQTDALYRLGNWYRLSLSLAVIGLLLAWWGLGMDAGLMRGVSGILLTVASGTAAFLIGLGRSRGKENVERMLKAVEAER